jgi:glycosyltransferase involved in cell wall biosynthesis
LKVLHLYAGNLYGGIETLLTTMARLRNLAPGMDPEFGLCFHGRLWDELVASGAAVHDLGPVRLSRPWTVWRARARLRQVLADTRPEVVVAHSSWPHTVFAPVVRRAGVRLVHFVHGVANGQNWLERWASRTPPDLVIANSRFATGSAAKLYPDIPAEVLYPPVPKPDIPDREAARCKVRVEFATSAEAVVILMVSRIESLKGHSTLLAALGRIRDEPSWVCWVVGGSQRPHEHELLEALVRQAKSLGITDRVRFVGPRSDVLTVMVAAEIYCQPNTGPEGFGLTFVEALYAGLPVVTSGFGGAAEVVDQTCGVLTKPGDPEAVAAALQSLIRDPSRRRALGAAGPGRAQSLCDPACQLNAAAALLNDLGAAIDRKGG